MLGFTLAEVLITLVIIGVIAAITVPTLIIKHQKEQTVTRLKKAYSDLSNVIKYSEVSNGYISTWDFTLTTENFINKYLSSYIVLSKLSNERYRQEVVYSNIKGEKFGSSGFSLFNETNHNRIWKLNSGSTLLFDYTSMDIENGYLVAIDINGNQKPNKLGKDLFVFGIHKYKGLQPYRWNLNNGTPADVTRNSLLTRTAEPCCNKNCFVGYGCSALIMIDGWQIKDDYPW